MKAQISMFTIVGFVMVFVIYVVGFYPVMQQTIASAPQYDPLSNQLMALVPASFFIAMIIGVLYYAFGRRPPGAWGGE